MNINSAKIEDKLKTVVNQGKEKGASGVKVVYHRSDKNSCSFTNGSLKEINSKDTESVTVTVIVNGKQGSSMVSSLDDISIAMEKAFNIAQVGKKSYFNEYTSPQQYADVKLYSPQLEDIPLGDFIRENEKFCFELKELDDELFLENNGGKHTGYTAISHSGGLYNEQQTSSWNLTGWGNKSEEGDMFWFGDEIGWRSIDNKLSIDPVLTSCKEVYDMSLKLSEIADGNYPVILDSDITNMFMRIITGGVNGKSVYEGSSPLKGKIGQQVLDPSITIVDDPHRDFGPEARKTDSDGLPTQKLTIINKGELKCFAYDMNTAALCKTAPTGHNNSSLHCPTILPGNTSSQDMIKGVKKGILVKMLLGFGQGNIVNGDFSGNLGSGFLIENGEIRGRVKNTMIAGNFYHLAKQNVLLSSDIHPINRQPYMLLNGVKVSTK